MTPEQWDRVKEVFGSALNRSPEARAEFLAAACGGDEVLLTEANRLLAALESAGGFLSSPFWNNPPAGVRSIPIERNTAENSAVTTVLRVAPPSAGETFAGRYEIKPVQCQKCDATLTPGARFCSTCGARIETLQETVRDPLREALENALGFQYRIERLLGRGGMGAVYLAHEMALDRDVAIKVLPPEQAGAPQLRERFRREARTVARLNHPNIVPLYTFGEFHGLMYFVMGYVAGESLASQLRRSGPLASDEARTLLADLADALAYAHRHGVIHRDIKPDNILLDVDSGSPRLTDFGIAKATLTDTLLTTAGQLIGTPAYMSPEQVLGREDLDGRSDIYSLGITAYEMVSGRLPFDAKTPMEAVTQRLTQEPQPLRAIAPNVDDDLIVAIQRCLQKDPANRWPDAKSLRFALVPLDDETDSLAVRLLRLSSFGFLLLVPASVSTTIFGRFNSGPVEIAAYILTSFLMALLVVGFAAAAVLRRQRSAIRAIFQTALRQPRAWKFWCPKRFRRVGDVWDRLPAQMRRVRLHFALLFGFQFAIFIPLYLGLLLSERLSVVEFTPITINLAIVLLVFLERHRVTKRLAATLEISPTEASKIMSTPSWRTAAWQRGPAASLIRRATSAPTAKTVLMHSECTLQPESQLDQERQNQQKPIQSVS
jgi:serine/threonine protein kinase